MLYEGFLIVSHDTIKNKFSSLAVLLNGIYPSNALIHY